MRILYDGRILQNPSPSGVGYYAQFLLQGLLSSDDTTLKIFTNSFQTRPLGLESALPPHASLYTTRYPNKLLTLAWSLGRFPAVDKLFADSDVVLCPHISVLPETKLPKVVTIHDLSYEHFPQFHGPKERFWHQIAARSAKQADLLIAVSYATKEDILKIWGIESRKVKVVYPGAPDLSETVEADFADVSRRFNLRAPYLLAVGTLEPRKNLVRLIEAFANVSNEPTCRDLHLALAGARGSDSHRIEQAIHKFKLQDRVTITGYITDEIKKSLYRHAEMLVYPSLYEGFGFPLLEAMQMHLPVIASRAASIPEVTGEAAVLVDPYNSEELAQAIRDMLEDSALRERCRTLGKARVKRFSWQACSEQVREACRSLK
ncbi:hypothetical protein AUK40_03985 [Candidatus Wirthbacteria bacterium CG2_30_54_11]|uniref:Glycosyl transferase family 1 n=1 Tax=Candidatus Wirthbacteria bacterium CG2_30_54_11 TaxID=1817892 RepID=A0A1J5IK67_9BACT|nr:MAG: hypothetical protein AUK40_03985 [Candidatus Wirthbacteria bacterium CG2_30_54_11]